MLKWKLMISTLPIVLVMAGVKLVLDLYFEFPGLVPFADVGVILTACVFLIGFLLAGTMADYKESERLPRRSPRRSKPSRRFSRWRRSIARGSSCRRCVEASWS